MKLFGMQFLPEQASSVALSIDLVYLFIVAVAVFFTILVFALVIIFALKYRRKSPDDKPKAIEGNHFLEMLWIGIPLVLALVMFFMGAVVFFHVSRVPDHALEVYGIGKQWMWKFQHAEGKREINDLHVPVGRPVKVILTSEDVIHSFYVPSFRVKMDVVPGRYTSVWFEATKPGKYHLFCAEYCGTEHSLMIGTVHAMEPQDYEKWLMTSEASTESVVEDVDMPKLSTMAMRGKKLFEKNNCNSCHGAESTALGPTLHGLYGSEVPIEGGLKATADDSYLRESILVPSKKVVAGYQAVMPPFKTLLSEEDLIQIIAYIKTLKVKAEDKEEIEDAT